MNYYNELDPKAAQWLRNLIAAGLIPAGDVDERSIEDVTPNDVRGYTQCHWFAGIAGWPLALALAGWPAGRPVWTGSCPCQPFSAAGKGAGFADGRHLWPAWQHLIAQCRPPVIFGEQVASKAVDPWIDLVHADMEGMGYAFGAVAFPAAGIGAPHIRDRTYWVADADRVRLESAPIRELHDSERHAQPCGSAGGLADTEQHRGGCETQPANHQPSEANRPTDQRGGHSGASMRMANANGFTRGQGRALDGRRDQGSDAQARTRSGGCELPDGQRPGPTNGQWRNADWLGCTDGKWRPVEPGTFPLAHGIPGRVVRLRAYGNAIVPAQAAQFIGAYADSRGLNMEAIEASA